ncbi:MAG: TOBE domain-containing protein, partial [Pseudonocardiaceae bacterium]
ARLAGLNMVPGTATVRGLHTAEGTELIGAAPAGEPTAVGQPAVAVFAPTAVAVHPDQPGGSPRNVIRDSVVALEPQGALVRVRGTTGLAADITPGSVVALGLRPDSAVWFVVKASDVAVHPTHSVPGRQQTVVGTVGGLKQMQGLPDRS